jgi:hypothetical protein
MSPSKLIHDRIVLEPRRKSGSDLKKKALQGARFCAIKRSAEAFRIALGGRRTLGAGRSVIPEICCRRRAAEAPPSSRGRTIGGPRQLGEVTLPELRIELMRLAGDQVILLAAGCEKQETEPGFMVSRATMT